MKNKTINEILFSAALFLNAALLVLLVYGKPIQLPVWLQVGGRLHPLVLHFPVVMILLASGWHMISMRGPEDNDISRARRLFTLATVVLTAITALSGYFLGQEEGYSPTALNPHKWLGSSVSFAVLLWYVAVAKRPGNKKVAYAAGIILVAGLVAAAHQGGNITHGKNFVMAPLQKSQSLQAAFTGDENLYAEVIFPILENKCLSCHCAGNTKGRLNMETPELFMAGGKSGSLLDAQADGHPLFVHRMLLPEDDKKHMPPAGKKQLTAEELDILVQWVSQGASFDLTINSLEEDNNLRRSAVDFLSAGEALKLNLEPVSPKILEELNSDYLSVRALYKNSGEVSVAFMSPANFRSEELARLEKIKDNIVELNVSGMPLSEQDFGVIEKFRNLRLLNLVNVMLPENVSPSRFENVDNLVLTAEPDEDLPAIELPPPVITGDQQVFSGETTVTLRHPLAQANIRYTTDGTEPDSLISPDYNGPVTLKASAILKARAFLDGWLKSGVAERAYFVAGIAPDSTSLVYQPAGSYKAKGAKSLTDKMLGSGNFRDGNWLGFREKEMEAFIGFSQPAAIREVTVSSYTESGSYIMPPATLAVYAIREDGRLSLLKEMKPDQPSSEEPGIRKTYILSFPAQETAAIKVVAKPLSVLPAWHRGKGDKAWFFVDEIFVN